VRQPTPLILKYTPSAPSTLAVTRALTCGKSGCVCAKTARNGHGPTHCPAHDDHHPSLSVDEKDGKVLLYCWAGCSYVEVLAALPRMNTARVRVGAGSPVAKIANPANDEASWTPRQLWVDARAAAGTLVQRYLNSRGLDTAIPECLRFAAELQHSPSRTFHPAMVAAVSVWPETEPVAVHRTFLQADGKGKASVDPVRMALGPVRGGAVQLAAAGERLAVAEGIETALSVQQATGLPTWAVLGATNLRNLVLPALPMAAEITIAADADPAGLRGAYAAAGRWLAAGRRVRIALPPRGLDFNNVLLRGAP
jgi:putative DNA primase/helicase